MNETEEYRAIEDEPVALATIQKLIEKHPNWRKTTHTTIGGQEVMMIEFPNSGGKFAPGLHSDFVQMVEEGGR
jgi:hypothetical protein